MDDTLSIRQAAASDLDAVAAIEDASFGGDRFTRRQLAYLMSHAQGALYIAEYDNVAVGYISLLRRSGSSVLRIYSVAVHPVARGRRIGQQLIDKALEYAARNGLATISLEVRVDNAAAIGLYEKNGFVASSIVRGYYADGTDAVRMIRNRLA